MTFLKRFLIPDEVFRQMTDVPFSALYDRGFRIALLDLDNTLAEDHVTEPSAYTFEVIHKLEAAGFRCCIVSNAKSTRSADFSARIPIECISYAHKPSPAGIYRALALLHAEKSQTIFFGDQIFTDIIAAKRAGVYAVYIEPVTKVEKMYIRIKRPFERIVRRMYHF